MAYYSDINIKLNKATSGDIEKKIDIDAVKNSIRNILSTRQGSRRMLPEFANNLHDFLFDPIDKETAYNIGERMLEAIQMWDNRVVIEEVSIIPDYDNNQYNVSLVFYIKVSTNTEELSYILKQL